VKTRESAVRTYSPGSAFDQDVVDAVFGGTVVGRINCEVSRDRGQVFDVEGHLGGWNESRRRKQTARRPDLRLLTLICFVLTVG
jgi:hypothetical protein